jgi:hypothetical protein
MYSSCCGIKLADGDKYCSACGRPLEKSASPMPTAKFDLSTAGPGLMQVSAKGAGAGALVGAVGRALVALGWLAVQGAGPEAFLLAMPSAAIGLLVGAIAGALGKPLRGAVVGFVLSAFVFEIFLFACASALPTGGLFARPGAGELLWKALPYMLLMGLAGAAAGGIGGAVAGAGRQTGTPTVKPEPGLGRLAEPDAAADRPRDQGSTDIKE